MIRLLIADDHPVVREGLRRILAGNATIQVVGEAVDGDQLFDRLAASPVDVVLLDITMPGLSFLEALGRLRERHPTVKVLVVSMHEDQAFAIRALQAGAAGYLTKSQSPAQLIAAIFKVCRGETYISPSLAESVARAVVADAAPVGHQRLSARELEIFCMLAAGKRMRDIAAHTRLSPKTVSTYRARILRKMDLKSNADIVRYALQYDLVP